MLHTENSKSGEYDDDMTKCGAFLSKVFSVFQDHETCAKKSPKHRQHDNFSTPNAHVSPSDRQQLSIQNAVAATTAGECF